MSLPMKPMSFTRRLTQTDSFSAAAQVELSL
jgi:hypothetical protein